MTHISCNGFKRPCRGVEALEDRLQACWIRNAGLLVRNVIFKLPLQGYIHEAMGFLNYCHLILLHS